MMKRHNQILASILVIQVLLSVVVFWPRSAATGQSEPVFTDLEAENIVALTIADADGNSISLRKATSNGSTELAEVWVLPDADDYPAQTDKITPLLEDIVGLTSGRLVTRTDASHKQLQVAPNDFQRRIEFETNDGKKRAAFYLGSSPSYGATHFRVADQNETYLTNDMTAWETNATASSWIDTSYLSVPPDEVTELTLQNANGTFTLVKKDEDDAGNWTMAGLAQDETLDEAKVNSIVRQATSVTMVRPLGKGEQTAYGMDAPKAVVTLETAERTIILRVGTQDPNDSTYVVFSSASPYYMRVSQYSVKDLVETTGDDFLQLPPTPMPEESNSSP